MRTAAEAIREAMITLGGEADIREVQAWVEKRYPRQWLPGTIAVLMADLAYPGNRSSHYPTGRRFLIRVRAGRYRLRTASD